MKNIFFVLVACLIFSGCSSKPKQSGTFKTLDCKTICNGGSCHSQCVQADGTFRQK